MRRSHFLAGTTALGLAGCSTGSAVTGFGPLPPSGIGPGHVGDLRYGFVGVPLTGNGYDPAGDAAALIIPGTPSPATSPIPGVQIQGSLGTDERYLIRVPDAWNGKLVVVGTPAFRSEFANDAIWSDFLLANGYAYACSNKGVLYNVIAEVIAASPNPNTNFPIDFDLASLETFRFSYRVGVLQNKKSISTWNDDFYQLTLTAQTYLARNFNVPTKTYAVGLSNGGAQVRSLLEQHPAVVDGGVDWSGVYWSPARSILDYLPVFVKTMQTYVASGFTDPVSAAAIQAAGYPADIKTAAATHPSLWFEYYAGQVSFYADLTIYAYALLLDPNASATLPSTAAFTPNPGNPARLPGTPSAGVSGQPDPQVRANYAPSAAGRANIATFAHTGNIGKPLISIAGAADMFITPANNATPYLAAVNAAGKGSRYWQYLVAGGTHVDTFANNATPYLAAVNAAGKGSRYWQYLVAGGTHVDTFANPAFGYGLQPQLPFAWAAFNQLVNLVEHGVTPPGAGTQQPVTQPTQIAAKTRAAR